MEYVVIIATDALNTMGVPVKLRVVNSDNEKEVLAKDERALATCIAATSFISKFNGGFDCRIEFLQSSVFEKNLKANCAMIVGQRAMAAPK